jgi:exopolyphosphatase/pppGpp-phosphohydrolase
VTRVGVIEIGSRAVRLLVADVGDGVEPVASAYRDTHLARALGEAEGNTARVLDTICDSVRGFIRQAQAAGAAAPHVFGTAAVRTLAATHPQAGRLFPFPVHVLDERTEALASLTAVVMGLPHLSRDGGSIVSIDQGAGSLEIAVGRMYDGRVELTDYRGLALGTRASVSLQREYGGDLQSVRGAIDAALEASGLPQVADAAPIVALGSAATRMAWLTVRRDGVEAYSQRRIHGQQVLRTGIDAVIRRAVEDPSSTRDLIDVDPANDDYETVIGGLVTLSAVLSALGRRACIVGGWSTRYGVAWLLAHDLLARTPVLGQAL